MGGRGVSTDTGLLPRSVHNEVVPATEHSGFCENIKSYKQKTNLCFHSFSWCGWQQGGSRLQPAKQGAGPRNRNGADFGGRGENGCR